MAVPLATVGQFLQRGGARRRVAGMILIVATIGAALTAARDTVVMVHRVQESETALRLRAWDPVALAVLTDSRAANGDISLPGNSALRRALGADALNAPLLRLAGLAAEQKGDAASARHLIRLSDRLSRRDLGTEIWLVQDAVEHGDVPGAIAHYDALLAVHPFIRDQFFPVIAKALRYSEVQSALIPYIHRSVPWVISFLSNVAVHEPMPTARDIVPLLINSDMLEEDEFRQIASRLLQRLVKEGEFPAAVTLADRMAATDHSGLTNMAISDQSTDRALRPLTWELARRNGAFASYDGNGQVRMRVSPDRQVVSLHRVMMLQPGHYSFGFKADFSQRKPIFAAGWDWYCLKSNDARSPIWHGDVEPSSARRRYDFAIVVPGGCDAVEMQFVLTSSAYSMGEMSISDLTMTRPSA